MKEDNRQQGLPKCAIYARSAHHNGVGIYEQLAVCKLYADQEQQEIVDTFVDKGRTNFNRRSSLKALLDAVRDDSHPIDIVLISDGRRLSDRTMEMVWTIGKIREARSEEHTSEL